MLARVFERGDTRLMTNANGNYAGGVSLHTVSGEVGKDSGLCFDLQGKKRMTVKRRIIRAGGWGIVKRVIKPIPIVGSVLALSLAGYEIKKKGLLPGVIHVGLDVTPVVGTAKNVLEIFTGDLIPDKISKPVPAKP